MNSERLELEAKVTFLERAVDAMQAAMVDQTRQLMRLEQRLEQLEAKVAGKEQPDVGPHDSPPPHY